MGGATVVVRGLLARPRQGLGSQVASTSRCQSVKPLPVCKKSHNRVQLRVLGVNTLPDFGRTIEVGAPQSLRESRDGSCGMRRCASEAVG